MNKVKYIIGVICFIVGAIVGGLLFHNNTPASLGTQVQSEAFNFTSGFNAGTTNQLSVSSAGAITTSGNLTANGSLNQVNDFVENGGVAAISTSSATYTLTAAQACQSTLINFTPLGAATTVTFPATSTAFFAACLPSVGSVDYLNWLSTATSTTIAAGAGGTLGYSSSASIAAGKTALVRMVRDTATTYRLLVVNIAN